jgi:DNA-binding MarR family transcriptional regulator
MAQEAEIFEQVFQLIREFERQFRDQGDSDLSTTQFQALAILRSVQPVTAMVMAGMLRIAGPTATRAIDSLERRGLVAKERDPQDRRIVWLTLTREGAEVLDATRLRQEEWIRKLLQSLTPEEAEVLSNLLEKLGVQASLLP